MRDPIAQSHVETSKDQPTLLWIGDRASPEFQAAYQFCEANVAQLAMRRDVDEAVSRPAHAVGRILLARGTRQPLPTAGMNRLLRCYRQASWLQLRGTLCEGDRTGQSDLFDGVDCYWHQWNQTLPRWLHPCGTSARIETSPMIIGQRPASVAVIAASIAAADPLMELIVSRGATAIWCRGPDAFRVRSVGAVWWDDSVARPASRTVWQQRIASCAAESTKCQHAWLVNSPRIECYRQARSGGVNMIVSKPFDIDCLAESLATGQTITEQREGSGSSRSLIAA